MAVDLTIDLTEAREYAVYRLGALKEQNVDNVIKRSLKRAATAYQTATIKETKKTYILNGENIKTNMDIKASGDGFIFSTKGRSKLVVYYDWGTVSKRTGKRKNNFKVGERQYYGARVYKKNKLKHIVNSFWVASRRSQKGVLLSRPEGLTAKAARKVNNWLVVSPSIDTIVRNQKTVEIADKRAKEILEKRIDHEIDRILQMK